MPTVARALFRQFDAFLAGSHCGMPVSCYEFRTFRSRYTLPMKTPTTPKLAALCAFAALAGLMPLGPAHAAKGTISAVNRKCVSISTPAGFVLVRGWINAPVGTTVEGPFDVFGRVPIFDQDGKDLTGGVDRAYDENGNEVDESAYIEDFGLSADGLRTKWSYMCES